MRIISLALLACFCLPNFADETMARPNMPQAQQAQPKAARAIEWDEKLATIMDPNSTKKSDETVELEPAQPAPDLDEVRERLVGSWKRFAHCNGKPLTKEQYKRAGIVGDVGVFNVGDEGQFTRRTWESENGSSPTQTEHSKIQVLSIENNKFEVRYTGDTKYSPDHLEAVRIKGSNKIYFQKEVQTKYFSVNKSDAERKKCPDGSPIKILWVPASDT